MEKKYHFVVHNDANTPQSENKTELYCKGAEMHIIHSAYFILHMCSATLWLVTLL